MADEITISGTLKVANVLQRLDLSKASRTVTQAGTDLSVSTQAVTTSTNGDLITMNSALSSTRGFAMFENQDTLDNITIGPREGGGTFVPTFLIKPGEFSGPIRLSPSVALYAKAAANTPQLFSAVLET